CAPGARVSSSARSFHDALEPAVERDEEPDVPAQVALAPTISSDEALRGAAVHVTIEQTRSIRQSRPRARARERAIDRLGPITFAAPVQDRRRQHVAHDAAQQSLALAPSHPSRRRDGEHELDQPAVEQRITHFQTGARGATLLGLELEAE